MNPIVAACPGHFELGESPVWDERTGRLYWIDIAARHLYRLDEAQGEVRYWALPETPGCLALAQTARAGEWLAIAMRDGIVLFETQTGTLLPVADAPYDTTRWRFNDGAVDGRGRWWVGTLNDARSHRDASLYVLDGARLSPVAGPAATALPARDWACTVSNGLAFSPDRQTAYQSDTTAHTVYAYRLDPEGLPQARNVLWQAASDKSAADYGGRPDGAAVDAQGNYWSAQYEGGRIVCLSPLGEILETIQLPLACPTMVAFGGADLRTLYVTSARKDRPVAELERFPLSGAVLKLRVDHRGVPASRYRAAF